MFFIFGGVLTRMLSSPPLTRDRALNVIDEFKSTAVPTVTRVPEHVLALVFQVPF